MIIWLFALFDLYVAIVMVGAHFDFFHWRFLASTAIALAAKAVVFNDRFLSVIDVLVALYIFLLIFVEGGLLTWLFLAYFAYKLLVSI